MSGLYNNQEHKLRDLARLSKKFSRAADHLLNAAERRLKHDPGSRLGQRASVTYEQLNDEYGELQRRLVEVCGEYI